MGFIHLNKHNINYVWHKALGSTILIDISFTRKTHFNQLSNTVYLCRLQPNYDSECKNLTRMNSLRCNTHDLTRKKFRFSTYKAPEIWYSGLSQDKFAHDFDSFEQTQHYLRLT
jgi:hypothetical protein